MNYSVKRHDISNVEELNAAVAAAAASNQINGNELQSTSKQSNHKLASKSASVTSLSLNSTNKNKNSYLNLVDTVATTNGTHDLIDTKINGASNKKNYMKNTKLNGKNHETSNSTATVLNENEMKYKFVVEKIKSKLNNANTTKSNENKMKDLDLNQMNDSVGGLTSLELNSSISKKLNKSSNSKGSSKIYDPDKHCGVILEKTDDISGHTMNSEPCLRSLTCKKHSISLRRQVTGRSKPFNELFKQYRDEKLTPNTSSVQNPTFALTNHVNNLSKSPSIKQQESHYNFSDSQLLSTDNNDLLEKNMTNNNNNNSIHSSQPTTSTVTRTRKNSKKSLSTSSLPPTITTAPTATNIAIPMTTQTANQMYDLNQTDVAINSINSVIENLDNKNYSHQLLMGANSTISNQDYLYNNNNNSNNYPSNNKYMNDANQYQSNGYYHQSYQQQQQQQHQQMEHQNDFLNEIPKLNLNYSNQMLVKHHPRPSAVTSFNARLTNQGGGYTLWNRKQDNLRFVLYNAFTNPSSSTDGSTSEYFNQNLILNRSRSFTSMQPPPPPPQQPQPMHSQQDILFQPPLPPQQPSSIYHQQQPKKRTNSNEIYDSNKLFKKCNNYDNEVDKYLNTAGASSVSSIGNETSFINSDIFSSTSYLLNGDDSFMNTNHTLPSMNSNNNAEDDYLFCNNQINSYQSIANKNNHNILAKTSSISLSPSPSSSSSFSSSTSNGNGILLNGTTTHQQQILSNDNIRF